MIYNEKSKKSISMENLFDSEILSFITFGLFQTLR